jgi:hypothetical protein
MWRFEGIFGKKVWLGWWDGRRDG